MKRTLKNDGFLDKPNVISTKYIIYLGYLV